MQFLTTTSEGYISLFFTLALMLVLLYFMIYRPQKKQEKNFEIPSVGKLPAGESSASKRIVCRRCH